ncbi:MAG: gamma-glutamyltransferase family protein [Desulfococcaceae bacterium]
MSDSFWDFPYPSRRVPVMAANVVATSQPLAAQAGLRALYRGGNAVDAAVAAAMALAVVEPTGNGLGSDAFALVWAGGRLHGFNGSGRAPAAWTPERFAGRTEMPETGWDTVTVPGAVDAWARLHERFGRLAFAELAEPALRYAREGFPVSPTVAEQWASAESKLGNFEGFRRTFLPGGRAPRAGERFANPDLAASLSQIVDSRGEAFYRGDLAQRIAAAASDEGGALTPEDLADHRGEWVIPMGVDFQGVQLHEIPPNGQGLTALVALGVLRHLPLNEFPVDSAESIHLQVEAMKIGFALAAAHIADPDHMRVAPESLLEDAFLADLAGRVRRDRPAAPGPPPPISPGTVYLATADAEGMMVSFIQSNYAGFGSGIVPTGTGVGLQNRGRGFSLEPGHPNQVAGGKRPFHTIIPGFVTRGGEALMSFGVMGAHMQPQGHVQMLVRLFVYGQNPQAAADAPRWHLCEDGKLALESGIGADVADELAARGHRLLDGPPPWGYGGAQLILRREGTYCGASDPRKDGQAAGF